MCLTTIDSYDKIERVKTEGTGYKWVAKSSMSPVHYYTGMIANRTIMLKLGVWQKDSNTKFIVSSEGGAYQSGFHIFKSPEDAENWAAINGWLVHDEFLLVKVKYKEVVASGYQDGIKVIVARKIKVIEEISPTRPRLSRKRRKEVK
jgi:hypothetical protein